MDYLSQFSSAVGALPDFIPLLLLPILEAVIALVFALIKKKKWFIFTSAFLALGGFFLLCAKGDVALSFFWLGLFACVFLVCLLPFSLPKRKGKKQSKADRMYEKYHLSLTEEEPLETRPPKITCFEETGEVRKAEECGLQFSHVNALLERLRAADLSAGDRLETDVLSRRMDGYRNRALSAEELDVLNDCLASVLKLTAKYRL